MSRSYDQFIQFFGCYLSQFLGLRKSGETRKIPRLLWIRATGSQPKIQYAGGLDN